VALSIEAVKNDPYDEQFLNKEKIRSVVVEAVSAACHFCMVAEHDGKITAGIAGLVYPQQIYDRNMCLIAGWYSKSFGDGVRLMDALMEWAERPMIKEIQYVGERGTGGQRTTRFLIKRYGFKNDTPFVYKYK